MKTTPTHSFITKSHSLIELFKGVKKMSTFMSRLEKQAMQDPFRYDPFKYVGDGFEYFVEVFLMLHPFDNRVGVYHYSPVQEDDNGVDGTGVNILAEKCVVQVKYRSNTQSFLSANKDHLSNMFSDGMLKHKVVADLENPTNFRHFVFTTADGLDFYTDQNMYKSKVKCIGYKGFKRMLDNNIVFWNKAYELAEQLDLENKKVLTT